jgi:S-adenosyl methyltransferase
MSSMSTNPTLHCNHVRMPMSLSVVDLRYFIQFVRFIRFRVAAATPRSRDQILGFFDGFELLEPGLVPKHQWRPVTDTAADGTPNTQWGGVGRKV